MRFPSKNIVNDINAIWKKNLGNICDPLYYRPKTYRNIKYWCSKKWILFLNFSKIQMIYHVVKKYILNGSLISFLSKMAHVKCINTEIPQGILDTVQISQAVKHHHRRVRKWEGLRNLLLGLYSLGTYELHGR